VGRGKEKEEAKGRAFKRLSEADMFFRKDKSGGGKKAAARADWR
jgi:hypothetical protein